MESRNHGLLKAKNSDKEAQLLDKLLELFIILFLFMLIEENKMRKKTGEAK